MSDLNFHKFSISSHVVRQLGEELITEPEQAILELIKNAHDAEALTCTISIEPNTHEEVREKVCFLGKIIIDDTGTGMSKEDITRSWLHISGSQKRQKRKDKKLTSSGRKITGEKGLGRLSSMRLGQYLRMTTFVEGQSEGYEVGVHWNDFQEGCSLSDIEVDYKVLHSDGKKKGTKIEILGLNQLEHWRVKSNIELLSRKLYALIFPFKDAFRERAENYNSPSGESSERPQRNDKGIALLLKYKGKLIPRPDTITDIEKISVQKFDFNFDLDDGVFALKTTCYLSLKPFFEKEGLALDESTYQMYFDYLKNGSGASEWDFELDTKSSFELKATTRKNWTDIASSSKNLVNPGGFTTRIYSLDFNKLNLNATISKDAIKALTGIWAYKDGFRIGNDKNYDWLKLSDEKREGKSFYSLRVSNVIGYIDLDGYQNDKLQETSNREGFINNEAYKGFWEITREQFKKANSLLSLYRRAVRTFSEKCRAEENDRPENYNADMAINDLKKTSEKIEKGFNRFQKNKSKLDNSFRELQDLTEEQDTKLFLDPETDKKIKSISKKIQEIEANIGSIWFDYENLWKELKISRVGAEKVQSQLENLTDKYDLILTQASIGVTAQKIAHDINSQLSDISSSTYSIKSEISSEPVSRKLILREIQQIDTHVNGISKEVSFLNPLLTSRLRRAERFAIGDKVKEFFDRKENELARKFIKTIVIDDSSTIINFNPGKFFLLLDNLYQNSVYWLEHYDIKDKQITVEVFDNGFTYYDSGKGIRKGIDQDIFDMFITDKPDGQGLGLHIVKTILEERNSSIELSYELNKYQRRYKFVIKLSGAIINE